MSEAIARIFVALDAAAEPRAAIDTAVRLAASAKVPLHAVFVEDEDLLSLAALPIARQIVPGLGTAQIVGEEIELQLRASAARVRDLLVIAAQARAIEFSFEIVRGDAKAVLSLASESDLVIAGARARPIAGHFRVEGRWLAAVDHAAGPVLLTHDESNTSGGVVALIHDRTPGSARLLCAAARLAEPTHTHFTVIGPQLLAATKSFHDWVAQQIEPGRVQLQIEAAPAETTGLYRRIAELGCQLLALDAAATEGGGLAEITKRFNCNILLAQ
jgi:hypothetical protein